MGKKKPAGACLLGLYGRAHRSSTLSKPRGIVLFRELTEEPETAQGALLSFFLLSSFFLVSSFFLPSFFIYFFISPFFFLLRACVSIPKCVCVCVCVCVCNCEPAICPILTAAAPAAYRRPVKTVAHILCYPQTNVQEMATGRSPCASQVNIR